ncbi:MAG: hypothetical protein ACO1OF_12815 [Adhaeribacter sp.]
MKAKFLMLALLFMALFTFNNAFAQNPHFVSGPTITDNGNTLTASGSIAGLGNNELITITLVADVTVTSTCTNPGGNIAPGQTKTGTVTATGTFRSGKNGRVDFRLTTDVPEPGPCPNGKWTGKVSGVDFSNIKLLVNGQEI